MSYASATLVLKQASFKPSDSHYLLISSDASDAQSLPTEATKAGARLRTIRGNVAVDVLGLGLETDKDFLSCLRKAVGTVLNDAKALNLNSVTLAVCVGTHDVAACERSFQTLSETLALSTYRFVFNETDDKTKSNDINHVTVVNTGDSHAAAERGFNRGVQRGDAYNFARTLGDTPANELTPERLVEHARKRLSGLTRAEILTEDKLAAQGFNGILAVGKGSQNKPCLGIFEYKPANPRKKVVLVGKGITFDTGGYSIKPKQHHNEMKFDMCGAANVTAALEVVSREKLDVHVVALLVCAENMVNENAQRPGDVYKAWNGKKVEVYNTDAEGRLILGDALAFSSTFAPDAVIDMATLTGGTTSIAGNMAGIVCLSDEGLLQSVRAAGSKAGEKFVYLELLPEARSDLKSQVADITNMHNKWSTGAPTMYAAAFLKDFVPEGVDWIHLDIANVAWDGRDNGYMPTRGATSYGARTVVEWLCAL